MLRAADLEAEAPVVRVLAAEARQHTAQSRVLHRRRVRERRGMQEPVRRKQFLRHAGKVANRRDAVLGRRPGQARSPSSPSGPHTASCRYSANGIPTAAPTSVADPLDADVGVDPAHRRAGTTASGVRGRSPDACASRCRRVAPGMTCVVGRVGEFERALLDGDQRRQRGERLGDRGQPEPVVDAGRAPRAPRTGRPRRRRLSRPATIATAASASEKAAHTPSRILAASTSRGSSGEMSAGSASHSNQARSSDSSLTGRARPRRAPRPGSARRSGGSGRPASR